MSSTHWALVGMAAIIPTTFLKDLSKIAYLSYVGVLSAVVLAAVILYVGFVPDSDASFEDYHTGDFIRPKYLFWSTGIFAVGFSGHPVSPNNLTSQSSFFVLPITCICFTGVHLRLYINEREAAVRRNAELYLCCYFAILWRHCRNGISGKDYVLYGLNLILVLIPLPVLNLQLYGSDTKEEITLNLPEDGSATKLVKWMIIINSYCTFTLVLEPIAEVVEDVLDFGTNYGLPREEVFEEVFSEESPSKNLPVNVPNGAKSDDIPEENGDLEVSPFIKRTPSEVMADEGEEEEEPIYFGGFTLEATRYMRKVVIRISLTLLVTMITVSVPSFDSVMSFAGAFLSITVSIFFPSFAFVKLVKVAGEDMKTWEVVINRTISVLGVIFAVGGTLSSFILSS